MQRKTNVNQTAANCLILGRDTRKGWRGRTVNPFVSPLPRNVSVSDKIHLHSNLVPPGLGPLRLSCPHLALGIQWLVPLDMPTQAPTWNVLEQLVGVCVLSEV